MDVNDSRLDNITSDSINDTLEEGTMTIPLSNIILGILLIIIVLVTIAGNILVLLAVYMEKRLRTTFNFYLVNLAVTDLAVAVTAMSFYAISTILGFWPFGEVMCAVWIFFDYGMTFVSVFTLILISIDRFWSVTWYIHYRQHHSKKTCLCSIGAAWVFMLILWLPPCILDRINHSVPGECKWEPARNPIFVVIVAAIGHHGSCSVLLFCYVRVFLYMRRRRKVNLIGVHPQPIQVNPWMIHNETSIGTAMYPDPPDSSCPCTSKLDETVTCSTSQSMGTEKIGDDNKGQKGHVVLSNTGTGKSVPRQLQATPHQEPQAHYRSTAGVSDVAGDSNCTEALPLNERLVYQLTVPKACVQRKAQITPYIKRPTKATTLDKTILNGSVGQTGMSADSNLAGLLSNDTFGNHTAVPNVEGPSLEGLPCSSQSVDHKTNPSVIKASTSIGRSFNGDSTDKRKVPVIEQKVVHKRRDSKVFITLTYIIVGYVICWIPFHFVFDISCIKDSLVPEPVFMITFWLTYVNSTINPILYNFSSREFREAFRKILSRR